MKTPGKPIPEALDFPLVHSLRPENRTKSDIMVADTMSVHSNRTNCYITGEGPLDFSRD